MDTLTRVQPGQGDISLKELLRLLWVRRLLAGAVIVVCCAIATAAALLLPKTYEASVVVAPVSGSTGGAGMGGGLNSLMSQFGGLASLAGLSLGADSKKAESLSVLQSEALTERYIQENDLLPVLYASKWDAARRQWKVTDPKKIPTLWKANRDFKKDIRLVSLDSKTGLATMSISWKDRRLAAKWANDLVRMTNGYLRDKAIAEAERNIAFLSEQAAKTDLVGVKQAIYTVMQTEISNEMLAKGTDEYALKVLDPAFAPEEAAFPKLVVFVLIGLFGGLVLSLLIVLVELAWSKSP